MNNNEQDPAIRSCVRKLLHIIIIMHLIVVPQSHRTPFDNMPTEYGWHVLQVMDRRLQPRESLEAVRPNIVRFLTLQGIDDLLEVLRERYPVTRVAGRAPSALRTTEPSAVPAEDIDTPEEAPGQDAP